MLRYIFGLFYMVIGGLLCGQKLYADHLRAAEPIHARSLSWHSLLSNALESKIGLNGMKANLSEQSAQVELGDYITANPEILGGDSMRKSAA